MIYEKYPHIRIGKPKDLDVIVDSVKEIKEEMLKMNISQWPQKKDYPSRTMIKQDLDEGAYFVFEEEGIYKGSFVFNEKTTEPYKAINWQGKQFMALHRLVSLPEFRHEKIPQIMMQFSLDYALSQGFDSIRLDTYSQNLRANAFYQKLGYEYRGNINLPWMPEYYNCYELLFSSLK